MKKILLSIAIGIIILNVSAQKINEKDVPEAVKMTFTQEYPQINNPKWEKRGSDYKADYREKGEKITAVYDKNGNAIEREESVMFKLVPSKVKVYCGKNLPGKTVSKTYKVTDKDGNILYDVVVEENEYVFDSDGNYQNKKPKKKRK